MCFLLYGIYLPRYCFPATTITNVYLMSNVYLLQIYFSYFFFFNCNHCMLNKNYQYTNTEFYLFIYFRPTTLSYDYLLLFTGGSQKEFS